MNFPVTISIVEDEKTRVPHAFIITMPKTPSEWISKRLASSRSSDTCDNAYDVMIDVHIGPKKIVFSINKGAVMKKSKFFRAAFSQPFKEASQNYIELPEASVRGFELFRNWLYTGDVEKEVATEDTLPELSGNVLTHSQNRSWLATRIGSQTPRLFAKPELPASFPSTDRDLIKAFILGDQLCCETFRNHTIDLLATKLSRGHHLPSPGVIRKAYEQTPENSSLRRLLVDVMVHEASDELLSKKGDLLPIDFVMQISQKLLVSRWVAMRMVDAPYYEDLCTNYHEHPDGQRCSKPLPFVDLGASYHNTK